MAGHAANEATFPVAVSPPVYKSFLDPARSTLGRRLPAASMRLDGSRKRYTYRLTLDQIDRLAWHLETWADAGGHGAYTTSALRADARRFRDKLAYLRKMWEAG